MTHTIATNAGARERDHAPQRAAARALIPLALAGMTRTTCHRRQLSSGWDHGASVVSTGYWWRLPLPFFDGSLPDVPVPDVARTNSGYSPSAILLTCSSVSLLQSILPNQASNPNS